MVVSTLPYSHTSNFVAHWQQEQVEYDEMNLSSRSSNSGKRRRRTWDETMPDDDNESDEDEYDDDDDDGMNDYSSHFDDVSDGESDGLDAYERLADTETQAYFAGLQSQPIPDKELVRRRFEIDGRHILEWRMLQLVRLVTKLALLILFIMLLFFPL